MDRIIIYHILHLLGVFSVLLAYGLLIGRAVLASEDPRLKKFGAIVSGVGLFLILLGGFGLIAVKYDNQWYAWIIIKLVVWVVLGGLIALINRMPRLSMTWFWIILILGIINLWAVYLKPGMG